MVETLNFDVRRIESLSYEDIACMITKIRQWSMLSEGIVHGFERLLDEILR